MVFFRRATIRGNILRGAGYAAVILTFAGLTLWGYARHRGDGARPAPIKAPVPPPPAPACLDARFAFATPQELLAPPAFPWSLAAAARLPRAEVTALRVARNPSSAETAAGGGGDLAADLAADLAWQVPALARPFTLAASPPYLVTPLTLHMELELDDAGRVATTAVGGAPPDLNALFAERATAFVFSPSAAGASFTATVKLIPFPCDRLKATRAGRPLADDDYRLLFRSLQYGSYPVYDAINTRAPELLSAERATTASFIVDKNGHPDRVKLEPPPAAGAPDIAAAFAAIYLPRELAGANVEVLISSP